MCNWLAHPNEFSRPPDGIELFDRRTLYWPPTNDARTVWLFKYRYEPTGDEKEDVGLGMVGGSTTFALFGDTNPDMKPLDAYALHCCFELDFNADKRAPKKRSIAAGLKLLRKHNPQLAD